MKKFAGTRTPERRSMRLPHYDYTLPGGYFITICTHNRLCHLGKIHDGQMRLSRAGQIAETCWHGLPTHYPALVLDSFITMPNHIHALLFIDEQNFQGTGLSEIVRAFKSFSARNINRTCRLQGTRFWQRGYFDHVVRQEASLEKIREYIATNPIRWHVPATGLLFSCNIQNLNYGT